MRLIDPYRFGAVISSNYTFDNAKGDGTLSDTNQLASWTTVADGNNRRQHTVTALSGKVYCEFELISKSNNNIYTAVGISDGSVSAFYNANAWCAYGRKPTASNGCGIADYAGYVNSTSYGGGSAYDHGTGDRMGIAYDSATGKGWVRVNGTWTQGDPAAGTGNPLTVSAGTRYFAVFGYTCFGSGSDNWSWRIYPMASQQLSAAPSGFTSYQP